jgi:hypothetical protein
MPALPDVPAIIFFAAALLFSLIGRVLMLGTAFGVSSGWGMTVLFAPFGPLLFRMKNPEAPCPKKNYWGLATGPLMLLFFVDGGTVQSIESLGSSGKPLVAGTTVDVSRFPTPAPVKAVASAATPAPGAPATSGSAAPGKPAAGPAPTATPSSAVAAANSAMPPAPKVLSPAERMEANRQEFERLAVWYDSLKHERGYLRKGDTDALDAFNVEAAKYQTALQLAKNEQAELAKLTAKK